MLSEVEEQTNLVAWFNLKYPIYRGLLWATANGLQIAGNTVTRAIKWKKFERAGGRPGTADLFLMIPAGIFHGLFLEMKTKCGAPTAEQVDFLADANMMGYLGVVCRGFDEAVIVVDAYMVDMQQRKNVMWK